ncbi:unnamed protein product [Diamesa serratosioi]
MDLNAINDSNVLDDEFKRYLDVAKGLMRKMRLAEDKRVCAKYIRECISMSTHNATIKSNRNTFFRYLLKAMNRAVEDEKVFVNINDVAQDNSDQQMVQWSADFKTYVAAKVIPGFGALIYMACTDKPDQPDGGWVDYGFGKMNDLYNPPDGSHLVPQQETKATRMYNAMLDANALLRANAMADADPVPDANTQPDTNAMPNANAVPSPTAPSYANVMSTPTPSTDANAQPDSPYSA